MTDAVHSAPAIRAQLFGGLMAFETSGGFRRLGSKAQARSGIQVPLSSPPIPPEILHSAISARVPQIPIMGVAAHLDSAAKSTLLRQSQWCNRRSGMASLGLRQNARAGRRSDFRRSPTSTPAPWRIGRRAAG